MRDEVILYEMVSTVRAAGRAALHVSVRPHQGHISVEADWATKSNLTCRFHTTILSNAGGRWLLRYKAMESDEDGYRPGDFECFDTPSPSATLITLATTFHHGRAWQPLLEKLAEEYPTVFGPFAVYWAEAYEGLDGLVRSAFPAV